MEPVPPLPAAKEDVSRDVQATCDALAVRVKQERRNMLILSLGVVILTPFLILAGVAGVLIGGAIVCSRSGFDLIKAVGALGIVTMFLTVMWVAGLVCQIEAMNRKKAHWRSAAASAACFAAAVALAHWTTLPDTLPALFWPLYIVLGICVIGIAGRAYDPTIQLTMDGAQIGRTEALGCVLVVCSALVEAYGSILGGSWVWRGLEQDELYAAALLLHAAARRDTAVQEKLAEKMGERKTVRVLWALAKLRFILPRAHALLLTTRGEAFLAGKPEEAL